MKPILFPEGQKTFDTNGLGRLSDAISCKVTEERNGQYELHMEYPIDGKLIEEVKYSRIILATTADGKSPQPFRIYRITKPLSGVVEIDAEHISYLGEDGLLHMLPERVITDGANIAVCYLPTTIMDGKVTSYREVRIVNGIIYLPETGSEGGEN